MLPFAAKLHHKIIIEASFQLKISYEKCTACGLRYERSVEHEHRVTNRNLATIIEYFCTEYERTTNLTDKKSHLEPEEDKKRNRDWFCRACE